MHNICRNKLKICILTSKHYADDDRIYYKEALSLIDNNYDVTIIAKRKKGELDGRIKYVSLAKEKSMFVHDLCRFMFYSIKENADAYHIHDPDLLPIGLLLKVIGKTLIYDIHEDYMSDIMNKDWIRSKYVRIILAQMYKVLEIITCKMFNGIIAVTPFIMKNKPKNKTILLRNYPIKKLIDASEKIVKNNDKIVIIYVGSLAKARGIKELIAAMGMLGGKVKLWLLGIWENDEYEKSCKSTEGNEYVTYYGNVPLEKVYMYMKNADMGAVMFYHGGNNEYSMPIKIFEYMACSLPIVMSDMPYWINEFADYGIFVNPTNPNSIAENILNLLMNKKKMHVLGANGRKAIEGNINWESESEKLIDLYKSIFAKKNIYNNRSYLCENIANKVTYKGNI